MLAFEGVPAVYYNSILASSNHVEGFKKTGRNRTLNRKKWTLSEVDARLSRGERAQAKVFARLKEMLEMRKKQAAFHPECTQRCLVADPRLFVLVRGAAGSEQQLLCVFNLSKDAVTVDKSDLGLDPAVGLETRFSSPRGRWTRLPSNFVSPPMQWPGWSWCRKVVALGLKAARHRPARWTQALGCVMISMQQGVSRHG